MSYNKLSSLPELTDIKLTYLDASNNCIESVDTSLAHIKDLYLTSNPLSFILPAFRNSNYKVFECIITITITILTL